MNHRYQIGIKQFWLAAGMGVLLVPLILYGWLHSLRPARTASERSLFQGIVYKREFRATPRPLMLHIVSIDLTAPGVKVLVTPGKPTSVKEEIPTEIDSRTTSEFLSEFKLQLASNASFFYLFEEVTPWKYYPRSSDRVNVIGQAISNRSHYSDAQQHWPVLCFNANNRAQIEGSGRCPEGTVNAVAGNFVLIERGNPLGLKIPTPNSDKPYARAVVAIDRTGQKLWLIAIDGKQPLYSEGATIAEMTKIAMELGADSALNLDGGGSTTLVTATPQGSTVLNAPIHTKLPMRERPVGNHIGFYALPKD